MLQGGDIAEENCAECADDLAVFKNRVNTGDALASFNDHHSGKFGLPTLKHCGKQRFWLKVYVQLACHILLLQLAQGK